MRLSRMTTRMWMLVVVVAAVFMAGGVEAGKWIRYAMSFRKYDSYRSYYRQGRVSLPDCVEWSRRLMDAQLALCLTRKDEVEAITGHIKRASELVVEEEEFLKEALCHGACRAELEQVKVDVNEFRATVKQLTAEP